MGSDHRALVLDMTTRTSCSMQYRISLDDALFMFHENETVQDLCTQAYFGYCRGGRIRSRFR